MRPQEHLCGLEEVGLKGVGEGAAHRLQLSRHSASSVSPPHPGTRNGCSYLALARLW